MRSIVVLVVLARVASAHQTSIKYVNLTIDGAHVAVAIKLAASDVAEPMGLAPDAKPTPAAAAAAPRVPASVQRWLAIGNPQPCLASPPTARVDADNFVEVAWQVQCAQASDTLVLDFSAFFALDKRMEAIVRFGAGDDDAVVVRAADSPVTLHAAVPHPFVLGLARGLPAACFALALVLVAVLDRKRRTLATVLGAFVGAQLVALLVGASGVIVVPARLAEALVALSLVYVAAENALRADARKRAALAVAFGIVHGLWLATTTADLGSYIAGVETDVVGTIAIAAPIAWWLVGRASYRRLVIPIASAMIFVVGVIWAARTAM